MSFLSVIIVIVTDTTNSTGRFGHLRPRIPQRRSSTSSIRGDVAAYACPYCSAAALGSDDVGVFTNRCAPRKHTTKEATMLAYDYPILGLFWTMLIFFLWVAWLILLFRVFADIFRSDMGGGAKALWSIFVILVPFLGVFLYVIANGRKMGERDIAAAQQREAETQAYIRQAAGSGGNADELAKLASLREQGVLTDEEFSAQKAKLLS
jgi:hypothetical protein